MCFPPTIAARFLLSPLAHEGCLLVTFANAVDGVPSGMVFPMASECELCSGKIWTGHVRRPFALPWVSLVSRGDGHSRDIRLSFAFNLSDPEHRSNIDLSI